MAETTTKKVGLGKGRHLSQIKRQRQNEKQRLANQALRSSMKTAVKQLKTAVLAKDKRAAEENLKKAASLLSKSANKSIIHSRNASRQLARLSKSVHSL